MFLFLIYTIIGLIEREMIIMIKTKTDLGPDEFKVLREIILAHPRLQKKER